MQMTAVTAPPFARGLEIEALMTAARWPDTAPRVALLLMGRLAAGRRFAQGLAFFEELAAQRPSDPLPLAAAGFLQSRMDGQLADAVGKLDRAVQLGPGLPNFLRGMVLAQHPGTGRAGDAITDLELIVAVPQVPLGLRRAAHRALAGLYAAVGRHPEATLARGRAGLVDGAEQPAVTSDYWVTDQDGFRFVPPRFVELAAGVHVAQGYDFADISFVTTPSGVIAIDSGSTPRNAAAARDALRLVTDAPITHVILTHAHWDHVGGLDALRGPGTEVIAQANFTRELASAKETPIPWRRFRPAGAPPLGEVVPDRLIDAPTTLRLHDLDVVLTPVYGGETEDALLVHLPERGVLFAGDILMPYLGAPFVAEGSVEGLLDAMRLVESLAPKVIIHGHPPLTDLGRAEIFPGLRAALESLYGNVLRDLRAGATQHEILSRNYLPEVLRETPEAVIPYLIIRDNLIKRVHRQRTGYWQPDGEGIEDIAPDDWALAVDLLAGGDADRHAGVVRDLLEADHLPVALRVADLALRRHPDSAVLSDLRQQTLIRLLERNQAMNPFKFVVYSELSGIELARPDL
jgi:glyoxylase-like metal-dependent hydrolase (beta-lactamase superfamily II)